MRELNDIESFKIPRRSSGRGGAIWLALALAVLTFLTFSPANGNSLVSLDDNLYVAQRPEVYEGLTWQGLKFAWTTTLAGNWTPLTWMSLQLDAQLGGIDWKNNVANPLPFHLTNVLWHTASVVLLFWWLQRATGKVALSAAAAAIFAVHPLRVESVAWVAERKDVLSVFWSMATILAYQSYCQKRNAARYVTVTACFALALLSKSMVVTVPLLLLLLDDWPLGRWRAQAESVPELSPRAVESELEVVPTAAERRVHHVLMLVFEKFPWLVMSFGVGVLTILAQQQADAMTGQLSVLSRLATTINGYAWYLEKTFWPTGLAVHYPHPIHNVDWARVGFSAAILLILAGFVIWRGRRSPWLRMGSLWFVISLLPVIGLLQVGTQAYADRYSYLPSIGLIIAIVWQAQAVCVRVGVPVALRWLVVLCAIGACSGMTVRQIGFWKNSQALWDRALAVREDNWFAHSQYGTWFLANAKWEDALRHYDRAIELHPIKAELWADRGLANLRLNRLPEAMSNLTYALSLNPNRTTAMSAMYNQAMVYKQQGNLPMAIQTLGQYCEKFDETSQARVDLGLLFIRQERYPEALEEFEIAVRLNDKDAKAHTNLALTLSKLNRNQEARPHLERALELNQYDANAHVNLAMILAQMGDFAAARDHFRTALAINPNDAEAQQSLKEIEGK